MEKGAYMHGELQQILGTDKRNPCFTVFRNEQETLLLFYGGELLESLPDDRNHAQYKLMVATLYNAGVNARQLQDVFKVAQKTMRGWGRALENGDPMELARVLAGRQASRKLTAEIQAYARVRFSHIYPENKRSYSKAIRDEIAEGYDVELSAESLRPLFGKLRKAFLCGGEVCAEKGETPCDMPTPEYTEPDGGEPQNKADRSAEPCVGENPYRKGSPSFEPNAGVNIRFCHHLGIFTCRARWRGLVLEAQAMALLHSIGSRQHRTKQAARSRWSRRGARTDTEIPSSAATVAEWACGHLHCRPTL